MLMYHLGLIENRESMSSTSSSDEDKVDELESEFESYLEKVEDYSQKRIPSLLSNSLFV